MPEIGDGEILPINAQKGGAENVKCNLKIRADFYLFYLQRAYPTPYPLAPLVRLLEIPNCHWAPSRPHRDGPPKSSPRRLASAPKDKTPEL